MKVTELTKILNKAFQEYSITKNIFETYLPEKVRVYFQKKNYLNNAAKQLLGFPFTNSGKEFIKDLEKYDSNIMNNLEQACAQVKVEQMIVLNKTVDTFYKTGRKELVLNKTENQKYVTNFKKLASANLFDYADIKDILTKETKDILETIKQ